MPGCGWLIHRFGFEYRPLKDIWMFPKIVVPPNGWFIMENPIKIHDILGNTHIFSDIHDIVGVTTSIHHT